MIFKTRYYIVILIIIIQKSALEKSFKLIIANYIKRNDSDKCFLKKCYAKIAQSNKEKVLKGLKLTEKIIINI